MITIALVSVAGLVGVLVSARMVFSRWSPAYLWHRFRCPFCNARYRFEGNPDTYRAGLCPEGKMLSGQVES